MNPMRLTPTVKYPLTKFAIIARQIVVWRPCGVSSNQQTATIYSVGVIISIQKYSAFNSILNLYHASDRLSCQVFTTFLTILHQSSPSSTSSPFSAAFRISSSRFFFLSSNPCSLLAVLKTPFVPVPQAAQVGSFLNLFKAHSSQK